MSAPCGTQASRRSVMNHPRFTRTYLSMARSRSSPAHLRITCHIAVYFAFYPTRLLKYDFVANDKYTACMSNATFINDDLAAHRGSARELTFQLTLDSLSEQYSVSTAPIRTANVELIEEGNLKKGPGLCLTVTASRRKRSRWRQSNSPEPPRDAYEVVASDLVQLSLRGKPIRLREETPAEQYDICWPTARKSPSHHILNYQLILSHIENTWGRKHERLFLIKAQISKVTNS